MRIQDPLNKKWHKLTSKKGKKILLSYLRQEKGKKIYHIGGTDGYPPRSSASAPPFIDTKWGFLRRVSAADQQVDLSVPQSLSRKNLPNKNFTEFTPYTHSTNTHFPKNVEMTYPGDLPGQDFPITVELPRGGPTYKILVNETHTIKELKYELQNITGIPIEEQQLSDPYLRSATAPLAGRYLRDQKSMTNDKKPPTSKITPQGSFLLDEKTIGDYGISRDTTLYLTKKMLRPNIVVEFWDGKEWILAWVEKTNEENNRAVVKKVVDGKITEHEFVVPKKLLRRV